MHPSAIPEKRRIISTANRSRTYSLGMHPVVSWSAPDMAREHFHRDGFVVMEPIFTAEQCGWLRERLSRLFTGAFPTGIYPDEWYWREGISLPDATRHMANAWKSDPAIASLVQADWIGRWVGHLLGWDGCRLGQDTIWIKPPLARASALHQDNSFVDYLVPATLATCWMTFDNTYADAATIEYVPGSHSWPTVPLPRDFHAPGDDHRARMRASAEAVGIADPRVVALEMPAGSVVFHDGNVWHGAGAGRRAGTWRHSLAAHVLPAATCFSDAPGGYIYRRYQLPGDDVLHDGFFPPYPVHSGLPTVPLITVCEAAGSP
jgi:phytanoyl-CoA hydroxylase